MRPFARRAAQRLLALSVALLSLAEPCLAQRQGGPSPVPVNTVGARLRTVAARAAYENAIVNAPLVGSTAWTPSTAYTAGAQVSNGGSAYQETAASCTSASSGGPSGFGTAITDNSCSWAYIGAQTAPAISGSTSNPIASATAIATVANGVPTPYFQIDGGVPYVVYSSALTSYNVSTGVNASGNIVTGTATTTGYSNVGCALVWETDSPKFAIQLIAGETGALYVDSGNGFQLATASIPSPGGGGFANYILVDWTATPTARQMRRYRLEAQQFYAMLALEVAYDDTVETPSGYDRISTIVYGDSITAETGNTGSTYYENGGWAFDAARLLGWRNLIADGLGGSGYVNSIAGSAGNLPARLASPYLDLTMFGVPDVIVVALGINDYGAATGTVTANVKSAIALLRQTYPASVIAVTGPFANPAASLATEQGVEVAIAAGVSAGDPANYGRLTFFLPAISPQNSPEPWIWGTGTTVSPSGAGNSDLYIGSLSPHPNNAGHLWYAQQFAESFRQLVLPYVP